MRNFDSFFEDAFKSFFSGFIGETNDKKRIKQTLDEITEQYGGKVETKYENLIKVSKTWTSDDGKSTKTFSYYITDEQGKDSIELEKLQDELQAALASQEYEKCAIIRDKINELKKNKCFGY
jgi:protein-arginine kinase activator protein McsA